ncbi:Arylsulfatase precursor [Planctomycetes bacterium CA13]|uniref:Arylsulfatase n=1 Tax=Novipirellula herctigrandis TaxID=2527986 RepID=A0A5C5Z8G9_9BACT|nr:Arylsulfatase precursor [Planctomycetes bacterium CA13]
MNQRLLLFALAAVAAWCVGASQTYAQSKPNVIVIVADDAGYADFGFMNGITGQTSEIPTPNLDALARQGVTFSRGYVAANCQPTRAALVTGGYQQRFGNEHVGNNHFLPSQTFEGVPQATDTIWDRLKVQGYTTGAIGKWHLGSIANTVDPVSGQVTQLGNRPENQGIDEFYGHYHGSRDYILGRSYNENQVDNPTSALQVRYMRETVVQADGTVADKVVEFDPGRDDQYITETFGDYAVDFIKDKAGEAEPFMLYQAFTAPHKPWTDDSPDFNDPRLDGLQGVRKEVASMMLTMDNEIGRMMATLDDPNGDGDFSDSIRDNTMIVFVNDNGGVSGKDEFGNGTNNGPLDGVKGSPKEGGIRVPFMIAGAGVDASVQGTVYDKPVHGIDILPTALAAAGAPLSPDEPNIDGVNLLPFINGEDTSNPHGVLVHRWRGTFAVIKDDWKLVNTNNIGAREDRYRLYNVNDDIGEQINRIGSSNPEHVALIAELKRDLTDHEVFFDKPRYAILANTLETEPLNLNDHFVFNPGAGVSDWSGGFDESQDPYDGTNTPNGVLNWIEAGTTNWKHVYRSDAFAGAVLEFGTADMDYVSNNDMLRKTGLEFMMNKMVLSGDFVGPQNQAGTIQGNEVLFTNDLNGVAPEIAIDAMSSGENDFTYNIDLNLVMYDDLSITGDGDVVVNINSQIRDYYDPRGLTKSGASKVTLTGNNTYSGNTSITGGTLAISGDGLLSNTPIIDVADGAVLDVSETNFGGMVIGSGQLLSGSGLVIGDITAATGSTISPGNSPGVLSIMGDFVVETGSVLALELYPDVTSEVDHDMIVVSDNLVLSGGGGDLVVSLGADFTLAAGDVFDILDFASMVGEFNMVNLPALDSGLVWDVSSLSTNGSISVVSAVPEPGGASLLWVSVCVVAVRRRRNATLADGRFHYLRVSE